MTALLTKTGGSHLRGSGDLIETVLVVVFLCYKRAKLFFLHFTARPRGVYWSWARFLSSKETFSKLESLKEVALAIVVRTKDCTKLETY